MELSKPNARTKVTISYSNTKVDARTEKDRGGSATLCIQRPEIEVSEGTLGGIVRFPRLRLEVMMDSGDTDWTNLGAACNRAALVIGEPETLPAVLVAIGAGAYARGLHEGVSALQAEMRRLLLGPGGHDFQREERETALLSGVVKAWWGSTRPEGQENETDR